MIKLSELKFLEKYEKAKQRVRSREELVNFSDFIRRDLVSPSIRYLREVGIIQEALREACYEL